MTDTNTTPSNPLAWLNVSLTEAHAKILVDNFLVNAIDVAEAPVDSLTGIGLPLGIVMRIQRAARAMLTPVTPTATPISNVSTTPTAIEPVAAPAPVAAPVQVAAPVAAPVAPPIQVAAPVAAPVAPPVAPTFTGPQGFYLREPPMTVQVREQLTELAQGNMEARAELTRLGVQWVVVDPTTNLPILEATMDMRKQLLNAAPPDMYWDDRPVVSINEVGVLNMHAPNNLQILQAGKSKAGIPWASLGLEGLIQARVLYKFDLTGGESERAIYEDIRTNGPLAQKAKTRLIDPQVRAECEEEVMPKRRRPTSSSSNRVPMRNGIPRGGNGGNGGNGDIVTRSGAKTLSANETGPLQNLLCSLFTSTSELREFAARSGIDTLPGETSSKTEVAFAIASGLGRERKIEAALEYLRNRNPSMVSAIDRVGRELGLLF